MGQEAEKEESMSSEPLAEQAADAANDATAGTSTDGQGAIAALQASGTLDMIMDIPVTLSMELGRTQISIKELLEMKAGSVIELQRTASEPMEIHVNGTLVAMGEAVTVGDKYGVRLTSVVSASERLEKSTS